MDLSVMHDNVNAIALYEKLGFQRVPVFALKTKNSINEKLYVGPPPDERLNPMPSPSSTRPADAASGWRWSMPRAGTSR